MGCSLSLFVSINKIHPTEQSIEPCFTLSALERSPKCQFLVIPLKSGFSKLG